MLPLPQGEALNIGSGNGGSNYYLDGWINRIWYMPTRQPNYSLPDYTR